MMKRIFKQIASFFSGLFIKTVDSVTVPVDIKELEGTPEEIEQQKAEIRKLYEQQTASRRQRKR